MIYSVHIDTPKETLITSPKPTELVVTKGLVYKVEVEFPTGSAGLMGIIICDGNYQLWPSSLGQWFTGDGSLIAFDDVYLKEAAPYKFKIFTYNVDTVYQHSVNIRIGLVSKEIFMARFLPHLSYKFFEEMLSKLQKQQDIIKDDQKQSIIASPFPWLQGNSEE